MALNLNALRFSKIISHKSKGLTLIEIIISVAILALALSLTSGVLISVVKSANKQSAIRELDINGQRAVKLIEESVRKSKDISYNETTGQLAVTIDNGGIPEVRYFGSNNSGVNNCSGAQSYVYMTVNNSSQTETQLAASRVTNDSLLKGVYVNSFQINFYNGSPKQIFVTIGLGSCADAGLGVKIFQTFVTSRGTYF